MSNWDLMMPGMGLTAIGVAGVVISYSGIAHTFIDGMHALTGLTMFIGLIFLSAGILEGGIPTSNKAKATTVVIISIVLSFAITGLLLFNTVSTIPTFAAVMLIFAAPAIVIAYTATKMPQYLRPVGGIMAIAGIAAFSTFIAFGLVGPGYYLLGGEQLEDAVEEIAEIVSDVSIYPITILVGSAEQGNPDYDPDVAYIPQGHTIEWTNEDDAIHTATSSIDFGDTFDSGMMDAGATFRLDTNELGLGEYEYMCIVHPWMTATIIIEEMKEPVIKTVAIPEGAGINQIGQIYFDPDMITVSVGTTVKWMNNDVAIHTTTSTEGEFDSDIFSAGESFEHTFNAIGTYDYFCIVHPWMEGTVIVE